VALTDAGVHRVTHRPLARIDHADRVFATRAEKDEAVIAKIVQRHATGQPVLVGTTSVDESATAPPSTHRRT
jgi:preprotein translocase subunit SecA